MLSRCIALRCKAPLEPLNPQTKCRDCGYAMHSACSVKEDSLLCFSCSQRPPVFVPSDKGGDCVDITKIQWKYDDSIELAVPPSSKSAVWWKPFHITPQGMAICNLCAQQVNTNGTSTMERHLRHKHNSIWIALKGTQETKKPAAAVPDASINNYAAKKERKKRRMESQQNAIDTMVNYAAAIHRPITDFEQESFQKMIHAIAEYSKMGGDCSSLWSTDNVSFTSLHPNLVISPSKAHQALFTKMRDVTSTSADFVRYAQRSMRILAEDALAEFPLTPKHIQTPCGPFKGVESLPSDQICAVSIVRSGDCLLDAVRQVEPVKVGKILIQRDESLPHKPPRLYYSKLPEQLNYILLCDPMLATGGSALCALQVLTERVDPSKIIYCNMICCPEGLKALADAYPMVKIVTVCVDQGLNSEKFIVPGLGDYGDRYFNT